MSTTYNYPLTLGSEVEAGQHYMMIDSYESKNAVQGTGKRISSIALYIPPDSLTTIIAQSYGEVEGGAVMAAIGGGMIGGGGPPGSAGQQLDASITEAQKTGAWDAVVGGLKTMITKTQATQNFMSAGMGLARNKHMAIAYKGPGAFRTHTFTFNFFPKEKAESNMVKRIINDLKNGSTSRLPDVGTDNPLSAPFFSSPRHYKIKFLHAGIENKYLFQIGRSVIETITINHDPQSVVGFHKDGSPVQTRLTIGFKELEYITSADDAEGDDTLKGNSHDTLIRNRRER